MSAVSPGQNISTDSLGDWVSHSDVPRRRAACADEDTCLTLVSHVQQSGARKGYILGAFTSAHFDSTLVAWCGESVLFGEV